MERVFLEMKLIDIKQQILFQIQQCVQLQMNHI